MNDNKDIDNDQNTIFQNKPIKIISKNPKKIILKKTVDNGKSKKKLAECNCKKSKCLKLYCECFAKGLICGVDCNC